MKTVDIKLDGLSVMIGCPAGRDLHALTVRSLLGTFSLCHKLGIPCQLGAVAGSSVIPWARDEVVDLFMKSDANRLFWIDSDMAWEPEDFMRLLAMSQQRAVICATYPAKTDPPTFYVLHDKSRPLEADDLGLVEIMGAGLGFAVMQREVIERLVANAPQVLDEANNRRLAEVFRVESMEHPERGRVRRGEDMAFFADIRALGYSVLLDPDVNPCHIGPKVYTGSIRDALKVV